MNFTLATARRESILVDSGVAVDDYRFDGNGFLVRTQETYYPNPLR
jgi:hypothetical protein